MTALEYLFSSVIRWFDFELPMNRHYYLEWIGNRPAKHSTNAVFGKCYYTIIP